MRGLGLRDIQNKPFNSNGQLEAELADARLLHRLSIELIQEDGAAGLYKKIVQAALTLMLAAQSTPLVSRTGKLVGMITTHWDHPYDPPQTHLELLDILDRQASDLIERTQSTQALRESEERLRALSNATNDVIYKMSPDWTGMYHLDGRNFLDDTAGLDVSWFERYILPEDRIKVMTAIQQAIQQQTIFQLEHRVVKADGSIGWVFSRAIPVIGADGAIIEWFGTASDMTEKKSILAKLEDIVSERTKELKRSNHDLQQFAHVASHDLKEPVRKIKTYGRRLQGELGGSLNEKADQYLRKIMESASRMTNNSLKFSKASEPPVIDIHASTIVVDGVANYKIVLKDNGIGFEPDYNLSIFEPFARLNSKTTYDGTGLGLSLSKKIVERHRGTIAASGSKDVGAVFTITLPVRQPT